MKKTVLFAIFSLFGLLIYSQNEASTWYFGYNSGVKFDLGDNTVSALSDGKINTFEGCTSISDQDGDLLFYTDGITVWNKNHDVMSNGTNLFGDPSSTQSAIIVPKPNDANIYYVFTVDNHGSGEPHLGLNFSEIDVTLDGGLGAVTSKNINLLQECTEKITAVLKDCVTEAIWVITFSSPDGISDNYNTFHAFEVSDSGVNTTPVSSTFGLSVNDVRGYLKLSPDGTKMACANTSDGLYLYDFDTTTGIVSNQQPLPITGSANVPYGLEFSPNSNLLYVSASNDFFDFGNPANNEILSNHRSQLIQYNLADPDVTGSAFVVDNRQLYRGGLQLGPNGKIYRALSATYTQGLPFLGAIENPNEIGAACNYNHNAVNLSPFNSSQGLPPFISSFFNTEIDIIKNGKSSINLDICDGGSYTLVADDISGATYSWSLNGTPLPETSNNLYIFNAGHYEVIIEPNNGDCILEGQAFVNFTPNPEAYNHNLLQCDEDGTTDGITYFNLNEANNVLTGNIPNRSTKFYLDAARLNEVNGDAFINSTNPQTIFVEVINDISGCNSFSELTLEVSTTDVNDAELTNCDDDGIEDGLHTFNLNDADAIIFNGLPTGLNVSYYETYNDALLETNSLAPTYTNTTPYSQTIYARAENANNCYGISDVLLTVHELPNIKTEDFVYYCLNSFPNTITIDASVINDSPSNYTYNWSNGETNYQTEINEVGIYTVTVTNSHGCSKTRIITVDPSNIASFETPAFNVTDATQNNTITVFVSGEGTYQYSLTDENNNTIKPYQDSNFFENVYPGIYNVLVRDIKNDCGTVNKPVSVIGFPKFFTPNNDGVNDTWQVLGVSSLFQPNSKIHIFDRFGKLLKQILPTEPGWDGYFNGQILPADDYWFSVKLQDGRVYKNHFTLKY
ncbi:T9SS type B sorting domain-containing protein [Algibacter sp. PT7-4]|uniref:T9SS type B sorting domain-containing protein n=1 Tax=Algibacter ulvanivorans TaxID=3400999 RepID=UPI003AABA8CB